MDPRTASQFAPGVIDASRAVLVELGVILRSYLNDLALIGGWAPYLLHLPVAQQARHNLREAFGSLRATGPAWVANFNDLHEPRARDILIADVYKTFERFFQLLS